MKKQLILFTLIFSACLKLSAQVQVPLEPSLWISEGAAYKIESASTEETLPTSLDESLLNLKYEFPGISTQVVYAMFRLEEKKSPKFGAFPSSVMIKINGDNQRHPLKIHFIDHKEVHHIYTIVGSVDWKGWRTLTLTAEELQGGHLAWGAQLSPEDQSTSGVNAPIIYPLTFLGITVEQRMSGDIGTGELQISSLEFTEGSP
jgi:hypothetical protein